MADTSESHDTDHKLMRVTCEQDNNTMRGRKLKRRVRQEVLISTTFSSFIPRLNSTCRDLNRSGGEKAVKDHKSY